MEAAASPDPLGRVFGPRLTFGVITPVEAYRGDVPTMAGHLELARQVERSGFAALWVRDVPVRDPDFGDVGQIYDPWVYLGYLAAHTSHLVLGTAAVVLTLRHPLHVAKAATSVDQLSGGRLLLGVASGDRPAEYPAFGADFSARAARFREAFAQVGVLTDMNGASAANRKRGISLGAAGLGRSSLRLLPPPNGARVPLIVTGHAGQDVDWLAGHSDAWLQYHRPIPLLRALVAQWRAATERATGAPKPFGIGAYVDLDPDPGAPIGPSLQGIRVGRHALVEYLAAHQELGIAHVAFNLKHGRRPAAEVIDELATEVLPHFQAASAPGVGPAAAGPAA